MPRWTYFAIFALVATSVMVAIHLFLWLRLVRDPQLIGHARTIATVLLVLLMVSIPAAFTLGPVLSSPWRDLVVWPAFTWLGVMFILLVLLALADVTRLAAVSVFALTSGGGPPDPSQKILMARFVASSALAVASILSVVAVLNARAEPRVKRVEIEVATLPPGMDGTSILLLSDLHIGPTLGEEFMVEVVDAANALRPDLVAITGDLVDYGVDRIAGDVAPLRDLRAEHGVFFVMGNHEYYAGADEWAAELRRLGVRVLINEHVVIREESGGLVVAGVTDTAGRMIPGHASDLEGALAGRDESLPVVLLAHQPLFIRRASELGVDVQLSGHTHHGQIWPWSIAVRLQQPYVRGLVTHGGTALYTSPGTGYWGPPMRLGSRPELTMVVLRAS